MTDLALISPAAAPAADPTSALWLLVAMACVVALVIVEGM